MNIAVVLCAILIFLVPLAAAGLSLINTGLGRSRNAAHSMMTAICVMGIAAVVYCACGFAWQGFAGGATHSFSIHGKSWSWLAAERFFLRGVDFNGSPASLAVWLQMFSVGLAALIPLGAGADRWRMNAICLSTAVFAGWIYPLFAHWVWGGGWLAQLGANYGLGRGFLDAGGTSTIHVVGGLTALSVAWLMGQRKGKYSADGMPAAIPGHNAVFVLFGSMLALIGWTSLNSAGALLFAGASLTRLPLIGTNTLLAASAAALMAAVVTRVRFSKPDASLTANGWVAGLVASSAACAFVQPAAAMAIGAVAGALTPFSVEWFEFGLKVDDPAGSISVHAVSGLWGILALAVFGDKDAIAPGQGLAQIIGLATLVGFVLPCTYGLNWVLNRIYPYRISADGERQGLDLHELGADAYPDFVTHTEEYFPH